MEQVLWRLAWALPLVVAIGCLSMVLLKGALRRDAAGEPASRLVFVEQTMVSSETSIHLLEVDGRPFLLVDSTHPTCLVDLARGSEPLAALPRVRRPVLNLLKRRG